MLEDLNVPTYWDSITHLVRVIRESVLNQKKEKGELSEEIADVAKAILNVKLQEQAVEQTKRSIEQARGLKFATWALVATTIVLALSSVTLIIITIIINIK